MIVPTMNIDEARNEMKRDLRMVHAKALHLCPFYQREFKASKLPQEYTTKFLNYKTKYFNEWLIVFKITKQNVKPICLTYYYDRIGLMTMNLLFSPAKTETVTYNSHFYNRYNERLQLGLVKPMDKVRHFYSHNITFDISELEEVKDGQRQVFVVLKEGVALGWRDDTRGLITMKTFVSNDMLHQEQLDLIEYLKHHKEAFNEEPAVGA